MTKNELIDLAGRYGMSVMRDPITRQAYGLQLETDQDIPELDEVAEDSYLTSGIIVIKEHGAYAEAHGTHLYKVICQTEWFDLLGFSD